MAPRTAILRFVATLRFIATWRLAAIIVVGLGLRASNLFSPYLLDAHSFRQGDTAGFALGYLTESFNPFHPSIARQPCANPEPFGRVEAELPLYAWLAVVPLKLIGSDYPSAPYLRCCWLAYFALGCVYLALLARRLGASSAIAEMSVGVYAVLPISVFFTVSIQPDGPSLTFAFAALYHLAALLDGSGASRALGTERPRAHELAFLASSALLLLTKLSNVYVGLPLLFVLVHFAGAKSLLRPRVWLWIGVTLLIAALWYSYSKQVSRWSFGIWNDRAGENKWSNWETFTDPSTWKRFAGRATNEIFTWPGIALLGIGSVLGQKQALVKLAFAWALGFLLFFLVTIPVQKVHDYYQLPAVVPAALVIPVAIERLRRRGLLGWAALFVCALGFARTSYLAAHGPKGLFNEERSFVPGIELVRQHVPAGEKFVSEPGRPEFYYNSGHRGFTAPRRMDAVSIDLCLERSQTRFLLLCELAERDLGDLSPFGFTRVAEAEDCSLFERATQ